MPYLSRRLLVLSIVVIGSLPSCVDRSAEKSLVVAATDSSPSQEWTEDFHLSTRNLSSTGESTYFILTPGYQSVLTSGDSRLTITVLNETKEIQGVTTRVIEEKEEAGGALTEFSRNFFAIDRRTGDIFYFGEEVDLYSNGQITGHGGAWIANENGNRAGLMMPGAPTVGMKYYQELAPGVAADRASVVSISENISTGAGNFENCLLTEESSKIEVGVIEYKTYCPGIGLVQDESLTLVSAGITQP